MQILESEWMAAPRRLDIGPAVCVIGDIHGCMEQLLTLYRRHVEVTEEIGASEVQFISVGDLIDRGPSSLGVLDFFMSTPDDPRFSFRAISGNHEEMFLGFAKSKSRGDLIYWRQSGGESVIRELSGFEDNWDLLSRFGSERINWIATLPPVIRISHYLIVHAGIDPFKALSTQSTAEFHWIKSRFLNYEGQFEDNLCILHGHTKEMKLEWNNHNKINLDTGAYEWGKLSSCVIYKDKIKFISADSQS